MAAGASVAATVAAGDMAAAGASVAAGAEVGAPPQAATKRLKSIREASIVVILFIFLLLINVNRTKLAKVYAYLDRIGSI
jgi:hypothetical protein